MRKGLRLEPNTWIRPLKEGSSPVRGWPWLLLVSIIFCAFFYTRPHASFEVPQATQLQDERWNQTMASIQQMVEAYDGDVGLYIKDMRGGRTYEHNADRPFISASLIKIPIMAAVFEAVKTGRVSLSDGISFKKKYRREGSGHLKWARSGTKYPLSYLTYEMITKSDNTATAMVIGLLGYDYLNARFSEFGLKATRIAPTGMSLASRLDPSLDNYTTAREMASLLEKIYKREMVSESLSDLMLEIMKGADHPTRLAQRLPHEWKLARKTGLLRKSCHDVGIVFSPQGDYIICVLTGQNPNYAQAKGLIASVGEKAYACLNRS